MFEGITQAFHSVFGGADKNAQKPQGGDHAAPTPAPAPAHAPPPPAAGGGAGAAATTAAGSGAATGTTTAKAPATAAPGAPAGNPAGQPAADPGKKPVDQKAMAETANSIFKAMDGWWVSSGDQHKVLDALRGKSPEEVEAIRKSYADHFPGHSLDDDLNKNLGKDQLKEAKASMAGDNVAAAVQSLRTAKNGTLFGNCDREQVSKVLEGITDPKQRAEVAKQVGPEILGSLSGNDRALVEAQLAGDTAKANAVKIDEAMHSGVFGGGGFLGTGLGQDKEAVYKALESSGSEEERKKLKDAYAQKTGQDLGSALSGNFSGTESDIAKNLLAGDKAGASAARVKLATEGFFFTDKDAIYKQMEGKKPEERQAMVDAYNKAYGKGPDGKNFDATLQDNLSGLDLTKAKQLEKDGKLDDAFALNYAMHGSWWSSDKEAMKSTLAGKSKAEIDALCTKYQKDYGIDLRKEITDSTSGRAGFEIGQMMKGEPSTPEERLARANEAYDFERGSGSNAFSRGFMDLFSDKGKLLDAQHGRIQELADKAKAGQLTKAEEQRIQELTGYQNMDVKTYQESKDQVANTAATAAAVVAATAVTVASGGSAAPAAVALMSAVAGGGASIATKIAIQDSGYSNEDLRTDLIMTGVSAATGGAVAGLGAAGGALSNFAKGVTSSELGQQLIVQGVSGAINNSVTGVTSAAIDPATWKSGNPLEKLAVAGGTGLLTGSVGGLASAGAGHLMGQGQGAVFNATKGAVTGGAGALAGNLVNPTMYVGDSGEIVNKWASSVGGALVSGAGAGYQGHLHEEFLKGQAAADATPTVPGAAQEAGTTEPRAPVAEPEARQNATGGKGTPGAADADAGTKPTAAPHGEAPSGEAAAAAKVVDALPEAGAGAVTKALPPEEAAKLTQALPAEKAARVSENMPAENAAQVHEQLPKESVHKVQSEMPPEKVVAIAEAAQADAKPAAPGAKKSLTSENADQFRAIDELKPLAATPDEKATIRGWEDEYGRIQPKDAFETAKGANGASDAVAKDSDAAKQTGRAVKSELVDAQLEAAQKASANIPELLDAQKQARVGANPELQGQRSQFEHALAREALANPDVQAATQQMSEKVLDYIERTRATPQERAEALKQLGATFEKGYAGAVGNDEATMRAVLTGGNVREQMLAIENFHRLVGADALKEGGLVNLERIFGTPQEGGAPAVREPGKFGAAEVADLRSRVEAYEAEFRAGQAAGKIKPDAKMDAKGLFSPLADERGAGGAHEGYASAKAQNMDTKLPGFTSEALGQMVDLKPGTGPTVGAGEANPLARAKMTAAEFQAMGIELSPREQARLAQQGYLEWVQGNVANMVNPDAGFISQARDASMPLQAGISGTTYRFMGMADLLGADPAMARLAAVGNLASIDAHSFHEIASAAQGFAGGYDMSMPYTPASTGLDAATLRRIAAAQSLNLDSLNNGQSLPEPAKGMTPQ